MIDEGNASYRWGDGLFETLRVENGRLLHRRAHMERLERSMAFLGYPLGLLGRAESALGAEAWDDGLVRVTVTRVGGPFDVPDAPDVVRTLWRPTPEPREVRLLPVDGWYLPEDRLAEHKTTSYLRNIELRRRALEAGFDDGLGVATDGRVGEASMANLFVLLRDGRWATPEVRGILPGVTRAVLIDVLKREQATIVERALDLAEVEAARAVVLTSAGVIVAPVSRVGPNDIPESVMHAERLRRLVREAA